MVRNSVAYQNKDIVSKVFADNFKEKSLQVYGLDIPKVVQVLPTNLPEVSANELRIDHLFLLEDGTVAIIDYESAYKEENKIKYLNYITRVVNRYKDEKNLDIQIRMIVIYTADVEEKHVKDDWNAGCLSLKIESAFLAKLDSDEIMERLKEKINKGEGLTDKEIMEFIILPLTYRTTERKQKAIQETVSLAKHISDEKKMAFVLSGILVFSDKVIDENTAKTVKEWINMTQIGRLYAEEKNAAVNEAVNEAVKETAQATSKAIIINLLNDGMKAEKIVALVPDFSLNEIREIEKTIR